MSVLIKGMKIPSVCDECWALDESGDYPTCRITEESRGYNFRVREKRMGRCPLVALPDKHGRLVDADALIRDHFSPEHRITLSEADKAWMRRIINDAPTIVESEGENADHN